MSQNSVNPQWLAVLLVMLFCGCGSEGSISIKPMQLSSTAAKISFASEPVQNGKQTDIEFSRDVLPILSNKCFRCHGPDENTRMAGLRLDIEDEALSMDAVVPGDLEASELIARVTSKHDDMMPPKDSGVGSLTDSEKATLRAWIEQGAKWDTHWAFVPPRRPAIPRNESEIWNRNPIDNFAFAKLKKAGLAPSKLAPKETLLRRASLLITGLPPTPAMAKQFMDDDSEEAYEKLVNQLLDSTAYGERMAAVWMDIARYSDTDGFQQDQPRNNWPWRDWVIDSYNSNKPFDDFTKEQFAGDLYPNATDEQIVATCFHRNHMTNAEGGRDPEESRVDYVLDRVNTVGTAWLGLTLGCAQCHSHKYDPISQKEYYQLTAFFNSIDEDGRAGNSAKPYLNWKLKDSETQLRTPRQSLASREAELKRHVEKATARFPAWLENQFRDYQETFKQIDDAQWSGFEIETTKTSDEKVEFESEKNGIWRVTKGNPNVETYTLTGKTKCTQLGTLRLEALPHKSFTDGGLTRSNSGNFVLTDFVATVLRKSDSGDEGKSVERIRLKFVRAWADYSQPGFKVDQAIDTTLDTGWAVWSGNMKRPRTATFQLKEPFDLDENDQLEVQLVHFSHNAGHNIGRFRLTVSPRTNAKHETDDLKVIRKVTSLEGLDETKKEVLLQHFIDHDGKVGVTQALVKREKKNLESAKKKNAVNVMVLKERKTPRESYVLKRGVWDAHGELVSTALPAAIQPALKHEEPLGRLELAAWLVDRQNPLTARVTVNRYWQMYFGYGLVRTPEDFGLQSEYPTHPALLDWLAVEFMESGWNIKHIHRLIATSATFKQTSTISDQLLVLDPENRLLSRGPRFRMSAAMIRDNALTVSGLLSRKIGGPSVKPYQPENVWSASDQGKYPYVVARGSDLYRRSLYTYWRRNISPPGMFDAAQRRVCEVQTRRTNSPMHALALLNDTTYVEAARVLAENVMKENEPSDEDSIEVLFQRVLFRDATELEKNRLLKSLSVLKAEYDADPESAKKLLAQGASQTNEKLDRSSLAALTVIASTILNLDETLNVE